MTDRGGVWLALGGVVILVVASFMHLGFTVERAWREATVPDTIYVTQADTVWVVPLNDSVSIACPRLLDRPGAGHVCTRPKVIIP